MDKNMTDGSRFIPEAVLHFKLEGEPVSAAPCGEGHINSTFLIKTTSGRKYIFQRINDEIFDVDMLMDNIEKITAFTAAQTDDPRRSLHLVPAEDGSSYYSDESGSYRVYLCIENSISLMLPESPDDFYQSAIAFGSFQQMLSRFPAKELHETIKDFHNTVDRYRIFHEVLEKDVCHRAAGVQPEIAFALEREEEAGRLQHMRETGWLPLRVTHNDTKLNNVMLDAVTHEALCVIDLDTVMPGLSVYDYGDSIRFGAATAEEDETDLSKMTIDLEMFRIYTKGFLEACPDLTQEEILAMPLGAKTMTLECGVRFLTDYLDGDHYFTIHRENHNLDRARTQFKLVQAMEEHWDELQRIVAGEAAALGRMKGV